MITFSEFTAKRNRINEATGNPVAATNQYQPVFGFADKSNLKSGIRPLVDKFIGRADSYGNRNQEVTTALTFIEDILDTNIQNKGEAGQQENNQIIAKLKQMLAKYDQANKAYNVPSTT